MKIAFISTMAGSPWGGSEEIWATAAFRAIKAGHSVLISVYPHPIKAEKLTLLENAGAKLFYNRPFTYNKMSRVARSIEWRVFGRREYTPIKSRSPFRHLFQEEPDVICIAQGANFGFFPLHDLTEFLETTNTPYFVICNGANDYETLPENDRTSAAVFFSNATMVGFVSESNLRTTERQIASKIDNGIIVRNPVNLESLDIVPWPSNGENVKMASVARFEVLNKGHDVLFEVLSEQRWLDRKLKLTLYGQGPDKDYINDLIRHFGIGEKVELGGHVSDVRSIWEQNEILLMPSRIEGIPLALVEAMICARPSVVTDVAGNCEWVSEPITGFVAEAPTLRSFGAALERAWAARSNWKRMGMQSHEKAISQIDADPGQTILNLLVEAGKRSLRSS